MLHATVQRVLTEGELSKVQVAKTTGLKAIADTTTAFMNSTSVGYGIKDGTHVGVGGRSIRVGGIAK